VIDYEDIAYAFGRLEFETELLGHGVQKQRSVAGEFLQGSLPRWAESFPRY